MNSQVSIVNLHEQSSIIHKKQLILNKKVIVIIQTESYPSSNSFDWFILMNKILNMGIVEIPIPRNKISNAQLDAIRNFSRRDKFIAFIKNQNETSYQEPLNSFPFEKGLVAKIGTLFKIPREVSSHLLWIYTYSLRLIPCYTDVPASIDNIGYCVNTSMVYDRYLGLIADQAQKKYIKMSGKIKSLDNLREMYPVWKNKENLQREEKSFFKYLQAYVVFADFQDRLNNEPGLRTADTFLAREDEAVDCLFSHYNGGVPVPDKSSHRRATEQADFIELKSTNTQSIPYRELLEKQGDEFFIRIILRLQDYSSLLNMLEDPVVKGKINLYYLEECLLKIQNNNAVQKDKTKIFETVLGKVNSLSNAP